MGEYKRFGDLPGEVTSSPQGLLADPNSNLFRKDPRCSTSNVIVTTSFVDKANYTPTNVGEPNEKKPEFFAYEETVSDIGGGIFKITTRYAQVPETWYSFASINIPYLKFRGVSVLTAGGITINTAYLFNFLNIQSSADLKFFNIDGFTSTEEKSGTINVACRIKHEYVKLDIENIKSGDGLDAMKFEEFSTDNDFGDGPYNCGYFLLAGDPQANEAIDKESTFAFTSASPSPKVKIESGVYAGNIYFKNTYQIIGDVKI